MWISVEDRMPEPNQTVIISGGIGQWTGLGNIWITMTGHDTGRVVQWTVTHWMALMSPDKATEYDHLRNAFSSYIRYFPDGDDGEPDDEEVKKIISHWMRIEVEGVTPQEIAESKWDF